MKINELQQRLRKDRPMVTISLRMPEDVLNDLKRVAPLLGFSGYQPLMRAYIGQGLRTDLERLDSALDVPELIESLRRQGVGKEVLESALAEAKAVYVTSDAVSYTHLDVYKRQSLPLTVRSSARRRRKPSPKSGRKGLLAVLSRRRMKR